MPRLPFARAEFPRLLPIVLIQAAGLVCGLIGVHLTSRLVAPADYGMYGVFVSLTPLGYGVIYAGLIKYLGRHWQTAPDRPGLLRAALRLTGKKLPWLVLACTLVTVAAAPKHLLGFGAVLLVGAVLLTLTTLAQTALQAAREHWRDLGVSAVIAIVRAFAPPLLYV
ncbi:MAG: hypothetical protein ACHQ5A_07325, partial [Opitutales bacterium]